ncbi:MAG: tRNA 2-thiouridine(34) synthase MnmA [Candidatus Binataceae bacterium]
MSARVMAAMSGGVDSSVAAAMLREAGYDVVGVAMRLAPESADAPKRSRAGACCSYEDFEDARRVAEMFEFPFYVVDMRAEFSRRVIGNFAAEYLRGRTPNPCVMCNLEIKFDQLWRRARALECDLIATGHYARIVRDSYGAFHLMRAIDESKDQSYFLFTLSHKQLSRTLFPLGAMTKAEVRAKAHSLKLANAAKPESQEICFVPDNDYAAMVERVNGSPAPKGAIVDESGRVLGAHGGLHHFTVGQRRGLGVAAGAPLYVREIRPETAEVVVAARYRLGANGLTAEKVRLVDQAGIGGSNVPIEAKIRYRHPALPASLTMIAPDRAEVRFLNQGPAVSPGQACVFYRGDEVLGGGFIERAL